MRTLFLAANTGLPRRFFFAEAIKVRAGGSLRDKGQGAVGWDLPTLVLAGVTAATARCSACAPRKNILLADYLSHQGLWAQVLDLGRRSPYRYTVCHAVDRALCRLDRLGDEMFRFPQQPEALLLTDPSAEPVWQ